MTTNNGTIVSEQKESSEIILYNLPYQLTKEQLTEVFNKWKEENLKLIELPTLIEKTDSSNRSKGFTYITFPNTEVAQNAINFINQTGRDQGVTINKHRLKTEFKDNSERKHKFAPRKRLRIDDDTNIYMYNVLQGEDKEAAKRLTIADGYSERTFDNIEHNQGQIQGKYFHPSHPLKWDADTINNAIDKIEKKSCYRYKQNFK